MRRAAELRHATLHVPVKVPGRCDTLLRKKDHLGGLRAQFLAVLRCAGLCDDRIALRWTRQVQWTTDREKGALVIELVKLAGIKIALAGAIAQKRVVLPAVPKPEHDLYELAGAIVSFSNIVVFIA